MRVVFLVPLIVVVAAYGQTAPGPRPVSGPAAPVPPTPATTRPGPGTRAAAPPRNLDHALEDLITIDAEAMPLGAFGDLLRDKTHTNIVLNWNALAVAGLTRDTPVTLHLKDLGYEQVVRTLMEVLPATGTHANYSVGDNTLVISTNAEMGKADASRLYDLGRAMSYSLTPDQSAADKDHNLQVLGVIIRAELLRAGEPMDVKGHDLGTKDGLLLATLSDRGQEFVNRTIQMFNQPIKVGQLAGGTQLNVWAKRTQDAYKAFLASPGAATPEAMARAPAEYGQFNIALLPGTQEELAKEKPDIRYAINDGGVLLLGPGDAIRARTLLVVYDLRDLMRKLSLKNKITPAPGAAEYERAIVQVVQTTIKPEGAEWGSGDDLGKKPAVLIPYNGLLVVFATAETHRTVAGALQDMNR